MMTLELSPPITLASLPTENLASYLRRATPNDLACLVGALAAECEGRGIAAQAIYPGMGRLQAALESLR